MPGVASVASLLLLAAAAAAARLPPPPNTPAAPATLAAAAIGAPAMNATLIAVASKSADPAPAPAAAPAPKNTTQQAAALGVPMDMAYLAKHPETAQLVPLGPPVEDGNRFNFDPSFTGKKPDSAITGPAAGTNSRVAAAPFQPIAKTAGFIRASGRRFTYGGKSIFPGGTSWFNMLQLETFTESQIQAMLAMHWQNGVRVLRIFGHSEGPGVRLKTANPIQPKLGVFSEAALRRFDFALYAAGKVGIRLLPTLTNWWADFGGVQWYVNQTVGRGYAPENFYTNAKARSAYKSWLRKITQRVNTRSNRKYSEDPTIFAWELCNECHTSDNFEIKRRQQPGTLVYNWQLEMAKFLKVDLGVKQMVTNGNEGYRAAGKFDPYAAVAYPYRNWMNTGLKGEDFNRMLYNPYLDFATIHAYAYNLGIPANQSTWIDDNFVGDRAYLAAQANKPLLLEEYGAPRNYITPRDSHFRSVLGAAAQYGFAGSIVWEVWPRFGDDSSYDFGYQQAGGATVLRELAFQKGRPASNTSPFPYACSCTDVAPNTTLSCRQVVYRKQCCLPEVQAGNASIPFGFCQTSCGRCLCSGGTKFCADASATEGARLAAKR